MIYSRLPVRVLVFLVPGLAAKINFHTLNALRYVLLLYAFFLGWICSKRTRRNVNYDRRYGNENAAKRRQNDVIATEVNTVRV